MIHFQDLREVGDDELVSTLLSLSERLRPSDLDEIAATTTLSPFPALMEAVALSCHAWIIWADDLPVAIFGCGPGRPDGVVWMVGTPEMDRPANALGILRATRPYLSEMHRAYPRLWNHVDARNERSIRWLLWAGFEIIDAHPRHGRLGLPFFTFSRTE